MKIAEKFYPIYTAAERDVLLIEFKESQEIANSK